MINYKFIAVLIAGLVIWGSMFWYIFVYGESVRKDPCSVCAERMGEDVVCRAGLQIPVERVYYANGSIKDINNKVIPEKQKLNLTIR